MNTRYASGTTVPVSRSRGAIDVQLRRWGCTAIAWADDFEHETVVLRFKWPRNNLEYLARLTIKLEPEQSVRDKCMGARGLAEAKFRTLMEGRGRQEHRILLLWITAALNAVELGVISAEEVFLPYLEGKDGKTVSEVAIPQLAKLLEGSAKKLLPARGEIG